MKFSFPSQHVKLQYNYMFMSSPETGMPLQRIEVFLCLWFVWRGKKKLKYRSQWARQLHL